MRFFINTALNQGAMRVLMEAGGAFLGIALMQQVVAVSVTYLGESVAWTATNALRAELARHCLNLDMGFHNEHTPGELIERIDGDVTELANFFSQFVVTVLGNLLLMIGILAALFHEDWRTGLVFTLFAAASLFALGRARNIAMSHQKARRQAEAELFGFVEEQLTGAEDVRSSGAVSFSLRELIRFQGNILRHDRRANIKNWLLNNLVGGIMAISNILAVGMGYLLFSRGAITVGTVYLFIHYVNLLESPLWALTHQMQSFQTIGACVERLSELRQIQPRVVDGREDHIVPPVTTAPRVPWRWSSTTFRLPITPTTRSCATFPSRSSRARCWACWGAPAAVKPHSPGWSSGCTTRWPGRSAWTA